jgi:hypothetical protein
MDGREKLLALGAYPLFPLSLRRRLQAADERH